MPTESRRVILTVRSSVIRPTLTTALFLYAIWTALPARAHSMYQAAALLDFHGDDAEMELQLPAERAQSISPPNLTQYILGHVSASLDDGRLFRIDSIDSRHLLEIDGAPYVVTHLRLVPPYGTKPDRFTLHCSVLLDRIPSQVTLVSIRTDWQTSTFANDPQLLAVFRGTDSSVRVDRRNASWLNGFGSVFRLGMRHIAEGTDHLLFLLTLLLPAPLLAIHGRWSGYSSVRRCLVQIGKVVTAFTAGHSVTLAAGAMNWVHVPARPIEVLIAFSILVSAIHALRPIFPGREPVIAGCFGLVHGLAFATTLAELGLGRWERVASIFGFNLGIETMQLVVVATAMPSLLLLSRTRLYPAIRTGGAVFAGTAATGWIAQRLWGIANPTDAIVTALAQQALWIACGLTLLGMIAWSWSAKQSIRNGRFTS